MYSEKISKLLDQKGIGIGDTIRATTKEGAYEGLLMPRTELGDRNCVVIKLKSGYNIGIEADKVTNIELKGKADKTKKTEPKAEAKPSKEDVVILGCGGTIASKIEYKTGAVYPSVTPEDLVSSFPPLKEKKTRARVLFQLLSEDMAPAHWQAIAEETAKEIKAGCKGIALMHGTDTMHYTSAALSFMLKTPVPIVLVGAQRSSDRGSSDNLMNLMSAIAIAESDIAEVGICMHGSMNDDFCYFHPGTKVRKMHTSRRDAFQTINRKPFARVWWERGKIEPMSGYNRKGQRNLELDTKINPNVALLYTYPGIKPEMVEKIGGMHDGLVIAGTGLGHAPTNPNGDKIANSLVPAIKGLVTSGVPVVMAPQTIFGRLDMNVYSAGRLLMGAGVIGNYCDWTPECALVKLMWVLGHSKNVKKVEEMMLTNLAGEISERSESEW